MSPELPPLGVLSMEEQASPMIIFLNIVNTITHLCLGAAACIAIVIVNAIPLTNGLTTHIYMCTVGYVILLAVGFLAFDPSSSLRGSFQNPQKRFAHIVLQGFGSSIVIVGTNIRLVDSRYNFETSHGIVGFIAMLLAILSLIGGVANFISSARYNRAFITKLHTCLGTLTIIMAFVSLCLGFDITTLLIGEKNKNFAITVTSIGLIGIVLSPTLILFKRSM